MENKCNNYYPIPVKIAGVGRYLPKHTVSSSQLEEECGLEKGWIEAKQGVRERRWVKDELPSFLAAEAAEKAAMDAKIDIADIDLIINASASPEQLVPDGAPFIFNRLGLGESGIAGFSMHTTCTSFVTALDIAACLIAVGRYKKVLVVSSETISYTVDKKYPETYTLLGDGAAAAVLTKTPEGENSCFHGAAHRTYGVGTGHSKVTIGAASYPTRENYQPNSCFFFMDGMRIMKTASKYLNDFMNHLLSFSGMQSMDDIKIIVTHQASKLALDGLSLIFSEKKINPYY